MKGLKNNRKRLLLGVGGILGIGLLLSVFISLQNTRNYIIYETGIAKEIVEERYSCKVDENLFAKDVKSQEKALERSKEKNNKLKYTKHLFIYNELGKYSNIDRKVEEDNDLIDNDLYNELNKIK